MKTPFRRMFVFLMLSAATALAQDTNSLRSSAVP